MGLFGGGQRPGNLPSAPPAAHPPSFGSAEITLAGLEARQRANKAEGEGFDNTLKTSPQGLKQPSSKAPATLLG